MVLTLNQTTAFFTKPAQMAIPQPTLAQMQNEGITTVDDLADFDKDTLKQLAENLGKPGGQVPNAAGQMVPTPVFVFGVKSQKRLGVACNIVKFYNTVGRPLTAANMMWSNVLKNFDIQWQALMAKKEEDRPDVPKITKSLPVIKWVPAFDDFLHRVIGVRNIPLAYVTRTEANVPGIAPPLMPQQPHSNEHGSVEAELVARASHQHVLFCSDNEEMYYMIAEASVGTQYAASVKPFQCRKDGRSAMMALVSQYAGKDKWQKELSQHDNLLHTRKWKGSGNFPLESFISQH